MPNKLDFTGLTGNENVCLIRSRERLGAARLCARQNHGLFCINWALHKKMIGKYQVFVVQSARWKVLDRMISVDISELRWCVFWPTKQMA
jgi:hypothetical protein